MRYLDLYGLFVDEQTGRRSMNVPGTDDFWVGDENMLSKNPNGGLDGFSTHMNFVGALYLWPYLCDALSELW